MGPVKRLAWLVEQRGEGVDTGLSTGGALIDVGLTGGDGLRVRKTPGVAALLAMRLRQQSINLLSGLVGLAHVGFRLSRDSLTMASMAAGSTRVTSGLNAFSW